MKEISFKVKVKFPLLQRAQSMVCECESVLSCEERGKRKREGGPVWDERREEEQTHGAGGGKGREC